ncbi:MAG: beta strand repeat-containing protein, partial [Chthoniobacterales bacterium]
LNLGADVRNTIIDLKVDFDAQSRRYVVGAKFRTNASFTKMSGTMSGTGTNVTHVGFANWNTGKSQDLLFDSLQVLGSAPIGGGTSNIAVSNGISSLTANTLYHYRVASMSLDGGITYGANTSFYTGIDLAVSATNTNSNLVQGGTGQFTINVANVGASTSTTATVTVSNTLPAGITMTSMSGAGWNFNSNNLTATRSGALNAGTNYPSITIGFTLAANAGALLTSTVTVSGGGDGNALNNTNTMVLSVSSGPDLAVSKATNSTYQQGGAGQFTVTVSNIGGASTAGAVTVTEQPPAGMSVSSMSGTGWIFNSTNSTVTRSDALSAGTNYPPISVAVAVNSNAPALLTNAVTVSGGSDANNGNNSATAVASVLSGPDLTIAKTPGGVFQQGQAGSFTVTVSNAGGTATTGAITVSEQPPTGMTVASMSGDGWTFDAQNLSVTRSDNLGAGTNYPPITVGVSVAPDAPTTLTNAVSVSGGGDVNNSNNSAQSVVSVTLSLAPVDAWRALHFGTTNNSGVAADTYVATEDGMPNLLKYALGLDPTNAAALSDRPSLLAFPPLAIKFRRAKDASDVSVNVEATDGMLNTWTNIWTSATNAYGGGTNTFEELSVQDPVPANSATQRYLRLKVIRP